MNAFPSNSKKRMLGLLFFYSFIILLLISMLLWVQIRQKPLLRNQEMDLLEQANRQRREAFILNANRGNIYDRNGNALTGESHVRVIIFPSQRGSAAFDQGIEQLAALLNIPSVSIKRQLQNREPFILKDSTSQAVTVDEKQLSIINSWGIGGIHAFPVVERYREDGIAQHLIGVIKQNPARIQSVYANEFAQGKIQMDDAIGILGLERSFDRYLRTANPEVISFYKRGDGEVLQGLGFRYKVLENDFYPLSIKTTLDQELQVLLENVMDEQNIGIGSAILIDTKYGDLVASVSRPKYNPKALVVQDSNTYNRAVTQITPGSVFKIVLAIAALEEKKIDPKETFTCKGEYGKFGFSCWKKDGHGVISVGEGLAQSCNIVFAEIAKRLGSNTIDSYAKKLGLKDPAFVSSQYPLEQSGQIFLENEFINDEAILIQSGIGQRNVQVTPLQIGRMLLAIVNKGYIGEIRLVEEIQYKNGVEFAAFAPHTKMERVISSSTLSWIRKWLSLTVLEGTASALNSAPVSIAGKTGTAQIANHKVNHWFAGYFPAEEPRYVIVMVAEQQNPNSRNQALPAVKKVVERMFNDYTH